MDSLVPDEEVEPSESDLMEGDSLLSEFDSEVESLLISDSLLSESDGLDESDE